MYGKVEGKEKNQDFYSNAHAKKCQLCVLRKEGDMTYMSWFIISLGILIELFFIDE